MVQRLKAKETRGRDHDWLVNSVLVSVSNRVSDPKTIVAANSIYSHKFAGHNTLASTFVATYDDPPLILAFPETDNL